MVELRSESDGIALPRNSTLASFLKAQRAKITPEQQSFMPGKRRVSGLRREEVANLAGISVSYYNRLEQGKVGSVSEEVLSSLSRALMLDTDSENYLRRLITPIENIRQGDDPVVEEPGVSIKSIVDGTRLPAVVLGRYSDVLYCNQEAHDLLMPHVPMSVLVSSPGRQKYNWVRGYFTDEWYKNLFMDWREKARDTVADLRIMMSRFPNDTHFAKISDEMCQESRQFAKLWEEHIVYRCGHHARRIRHPKMGNSFVCDDLLEISEEPGHRLIFFTFSSNA